MFWVDREMPSGVPTELKEKVRWIDKNKGK
jgi:hypothetical protein